LLSCNFFFFSFSFLPKQSSFAYSYESVQNVLGRVVGENDDIAVMVSAHYDSVAFSPGASDNGAAVAVALEVLQNLLALKASGEVLPVSVIFLFDDGEEAGLLGASAFTQHPWYQDVVTYVNLGKSEEQFKISLANVKMGAGGENKQRLEWWMGSCAPHASWSADRVASLCVRVIGQVRRSVRCCCRHFCNPPLWVCEFRVYAFYQQNCIAEQTTSCLQVTT